LPTVDEDILDVRKAYVISDKVALHLRAIKTFTDQYGTDRRAGDEWLIEKQRTDTHILDAYEDIVSLVDITILASN
jgi:major vault protein